MQLRKNQPEKKKSIEGYGSATTTVNFQMRNFLVEQKNATKKFSIIILNVFRFLKKSITKWESLNFFWEPLSLICIDWEAETGLRI